LFRLILYFWLCFSFCGFMRRLVVLGDVEGVKKAVRDEIKCSDDAGYVTRLHAVLDVCDGLSCREAGERIGRSARCVELWVNRFNGLGMDGLKYEPRPGRPSRLDMGVLREVAQDLRTTPRSFDYPQNLWDGKLLSHHLEKRYNISLGVRQCQRLFHHLGFRLRAPRPVSDKMNPEWGEAFKKD
jgi:transposase